MSVIKTENVTTFEGKTFKQIPIPAKKQDGFDPVISLYKDVDNGTLIVCRNDDVLLKIIGEDFTVVPLD